MDSVDVTITKSGKIKLGYCGYLFSLQKMYVKFKVQSITLQLERFPLQAEIYFSGIRDSEEVKSSVCIPIGSLSFEGYAYET